VRFVRLGEQQTIAYRDKKVVGVFVRFSCAAASGYLATDFAQSRHSALLVCSEESHCYSR
jgi:hypothetical protein